MTDKFYYKIYGLCVQSDIAIPGAMVSEAFDRPDVTAVLGKIPEFFKEGREKGLRNLDQ